jgi:hypothetical protein
MADDSTNPVDELAQDIRTLDGNNDLGAAKLAQALTDLGYSKGKAEYPYESGDVIVLGPDIFVSKDGKVISWKGENFVPQAAVKPLTLKDFKDGEQVEVFSAKAGDFIPGFIQDRDRVSGHLHVHTDRGPVTVGTVNYVRKRS